MIRAAAVWSAIAIAATPWVVGCQAKVLAPTPADQLRRQNADLSAKVESLERQLSEVRTAQAEAAARRTAGDPQSGGGDGQGEGGSRALSAEEIEATPHLAAIGIVGSSHTDRPLSGDGCVARIYLNPMDGRGRFLQVVGTATVTLYWSPPGCDAEVIACHEFGPLAIRDAYRSGFGGTHYTLEWPVERRPASGIGGADPESAWICGSPVEAKVEFTEARSGRVFTARLALAATGSVKGDHQ